jgi:hypothetical protein
MPMVLRFYSMEHLDLKTQDLESRQVVLLSDIGPIFWLWLCFNDSSNPNLTYWPHGLREVTCMKEPSAQQICINEKRNEAPV